MTPKILPRGQRTAARPHHRRQQRAGPGHGRRPGRDRRVRRPDQPVRRTGPGDRRTPAGSHRPRTRRARRDLGSPGRGRGSGAPGRDRHADQQRRDRHAHGQSGIPVRAAGLLEGCPGRLPRRRGHQPDRLFPGRAGGDPADADGRTRPHCQHIDESLDHEPGRVRALWALPGGRRGPVPDHGGRPAGHRRHREHAAAGRGHPYRHGPAGGTGPGAARSRHHGAADRVAGVGRGQRRAR